MSRVNDITALALVITICFSLKHNEIKTKYIAQPLDHFSNTTTHFQMLYFERLDFWKPSGPVFVYIGGEIEATDRYLKRSGMVKLAMQTMGAMFVIEHRFYGKSKPTGISNYKHLNTAQVLADLAKFVRTIKKEERFSKSKVVAIGVSYSGSLASWVRQKYPDLVDAAWASSAPVLAKFDFCEYYETIGELYKTFGGETCYNNIEYIFKYHTKLFDKSTFEQLKREENICPGVEISKPLQKQVYFDVEIRKYDQFSKYKDINKMCGMLNNVIHDKQSQNSSMSQNLRGNCIKASFEYKPPVYSEDVAWAWQCCTEFGFFITTSSNKQPFCKTIPIEYPMEKCKIFRINVNSIKRYIEHTNNVYGGLSPNVTKVVYVNGALDPWHNLGITQDLSDDAPAIFLKNQSHGDDFKPMKREDSKEINEARKKIRRLIKKWIS